MKPSDLFPLLMSAPANARLVIATVDGNEIDIIDAKHYGNLIVFTANVYDEPDEEGDMCIEGLTLETSLYNLNKILSSPPWPDKLRKRLKQIAKELETEIQQNIREYQ